MKRVMITGAGGFIGRNLTARLVRENIHVYGVDVENAQDRIIAAENVTKISVTNRGGGALKQLRQRSLM